MASRCQHSRELVENFFVLREAKRLELGEDFFPIHDDLEGPTMALHKGCDCSVFFFDRSLQTCSILEVVSLNAIFDADLHRLHSLRL
jgi:hypothetical protein